MLKVGDIIVYIKDINREFDGLTVNKHYTIEHLRPYPNDICIVDDDGCYWWFGQIGESECWTMWFITKKQWERNEKIQTLLI